VSTKHEVENAHKQHIKVALQNGAMQQIICKETVNPGAMAEYSLASNGEFA
jgi:hypothetical protein